MNAIADIVGWIVLSTMFLFVLYAMVMRAKRKLEAGTISTTQKVVGYVLVSIGLPLDVAYNMTVAVFVFFWLGVVDRVINGRLMKFSWLPHEWTLTARLRRYRAERSWSFTKALAIFICDRWLNPYDKGHC